MFCIFQKVVGLVEWVVFSSVSGEKTDLVMKSTISGRLLGCSGVVEPVFGGASCALL